MGALRNFKNVKNTHAGVLLLVTLQVEACILLQSILKRISLYPCNFTKSNSPT